MRYIRQDHRSEPHSRIEDWLANFPSGGIREMCAWEQYCRFAREPERRRVGVDARVSVEGTSYEVEPDMAGEYVLLLCGCSTTNCTSSTKACAPAHTIRSPGRSR